MNPLNIKKIILITCYFGEFPWYFNLFLKSCTFNLSIDFIIFSDCLIYPALPDNVRIIPFSISIFNKLASKKLGFKININKAYKLCDFKPAYGVIFSEYINGYSFWGMTDIDIIFGRIREFMTDDLFNTYDVVSVRNDYPTGSFMLFKNNDYVNNLFKISKDYKKIFQSQKHFCFDECNFKHDFLQHNGNIFHIECEIESMHHVIKNEEQAGNLKAHFDFLVIEGLPGQLKWDKGLLSFKNEFEVLLYHLILYKANTYSRKIIWRNIPDTFYIDKYNIRKYCQKSINGKLTYWFYEFFFPFFKKCYFKLDAYLSKRSSKNTRSLPTSNFVLGDNLISLIKNSKNENRIVFGKQEISFPIIDSVFSKNAFFLKSSSLKRYHYDLSKGQIKTLSLDGVTQVLQKQNI